MNRYDKAADGIRIAREAADTIVSLVEDLRNACERYEAGVTAARDGMDNDYIGGRLLLEIRRSERLREVLRETSAASFSVSAKRELQAAWETLP